MDLNFVVEGTCPDTAARRGRFRTTHGEVETPIFMPVGTLASVKALTPEELYALGATIILGNTYHLAIRPGVDTLTALGGMHTMYNWKRSILTDSGGFQMLSLADLRKVDERGVRFRNHVDGAMLDLTPEHAIEIQAAIGSDIMMCLDHLEASTAPRRVHEDAMARTTRWALRCLEARKRTDQALFAILQGGVDKALRTRHVEELCQHPFDGFAIGGLSVGESIEVMYDVLGHTTAGMPADKPRYLMGVGTPQDLVEGVARGVDMFDCVMPTRNARKGGIFVDGGRRKLNLKNAQFRNQRAPLDERCTCYTCRNYGAGFLRQQMLAKEFLAHRLLSIHNLHVYLTLMADIRRALRDGTFAALRASFSQG
ncbi:MAG: tRNA guanosine(34) transglycosylase Tgt [Myxococcales bacterium]|nr:tRNA guanosine(34) transglycosylase Tgt [Myxococcales bacterium]MCB9522003.1 tRNA guanosine(34) transglycosylase Tgt [Myxococcales bacterium]